MVCAIGVEISVCVAVVCMVPMAPPFYASLDGACTGYGKEVFKGFGCVVGVVGP